MQKGAEIKKKRRKLEEAQVQQGAKRETRPARKKTRR